MGASSSSTSQNEWGRKCPQELIEFMDEKHDLDLSMHETDCYSRDVFENNFIIPVGSNACNLVKSYIERCNKNTRNYNYGKTVSNGKWPKNFVSPLTDHTRNNIKI